MKKTITVMTFGALFAMAFITSCTSPAEEVEKAKQGVNEANENLDKAQEEYLREIEEYKRETAAKIEANEQEIADLLVLSEKEKKEARAAYKREVEEMRAENQALKEKMENYGAQGEYEWQEFKQEFEEEMIQLGKDLNDFRIKRRVE